MAEDPGDRWRIRWWMKFMDQWLAPSFSMIGWSIFVGPAVRSKDPEELKAAIERIPLPERRVAWRKAVYGLFGDDEMKEPQRRVTGGMRMLEAALSRRAWVARDRDRVADSDGVHRAHAVPSSHP